MNKEESNNNTKDTFVPKIHDAQVRTDYVEWLIDLKSRYKNAQIKAAVKVNSERKTLPTW